MIFLREHSLSIVLFGGGAVFTIIAYPLTPEDGNFWYDWSMMAAGGFIGSAILVVLARFLWERDSDPTKPPEECR